MADAKLTALSATTSLSTDDLLYVVDDPGGTPASKKITAANVKIFMGSGQTLCRFGPLDNEPPATNYATLDTRNGHPVLDFDTTTQESAIFTGILPRSYAGGGITVYVHWAATSATSGTIGWDVAFERIGDSQQDIDSDGFATAQTITATTVPGTSGHVDITNVAVTDGANIDSIAAGEVFRLRIRRDVANDSAAGDAELVYVELKET